MVLTKTAVTMSSGSQKIWKLVYFVLNLEPRWPVSLTCWCFFVWYLWNKETYQNTAGGHGRPLTLLMKNFLILSDLNSIFWNIRTPKCTACLGVQFPSAAPRGRGRFAPAPLGILLLPMFGMILGWFLLFNFCWWFFDFFVCQFLLLFWSGRRPFCEGGRQPTQENTHYCATRV